MAQKKSSLTPHPPKIHSFSSLRLAATNGVRYLQEASIFSNVNHQSFTLEFWIAVIFPFLNLLKLIDHWTMKQRLSLLNFGLLDQIPSTKRSHISTSVFFLHGLVPSPCYLHFGGKLHRVLSYHLPPFTGLSPKNYPSKWRILHQCSTVFTQGLDFSSC